MPLDRHAQRLLKMLSLSTGGGPAGAAERRRGLESLRALGEQDPPDSVSVQPLNLPGPGARAARLYAAPGSGTAAPGLLYLHGGGWVAGGLDTHDSLCARLALASGAKIIALDYRLAPEHPFPAALEDTQAALAWLVDAAASLDLDPKRIGLAGDSAGATLAAAASLAAAQKPALLLMICPILDIARESASRRAFAQGYFLDQAALAADLADYLPADAEPSDPRLSPLMAPDLSGLPPTLIHTAEFDPFRDEGMAFAERLAAIGAKVRHTNHAGMIHYFYALSRMIPHGADAVQAMGEELRAAFAEL